MKRSRIVLFDYFVSIHSFQPAKTVVEKSPKMDFSRIDSPTTEEMPPNSNVSEAAANSDDRVSYPW